ncbi:MAG: carbonic anhydrase [Oligoflexia bacterium]|nr:carbonic anhydrase [Oligoflexia bacterium]
MKKLIRGIVEFRRNVQDSYRKSFGPLARGQAPDALLIACSDSRVVPNVFASTNPGDLFVSRNIGNIVPPHGVFMGGDSEAAIIEFSVLRLNVLDIIVCGHSECGAMQALINGRKNIETPALKNWLRHGDPALDLLNSGVVLDSSLEKHNQLSQINVLTQIEHIKTYPIVKRRIKEGRLAIHGWWFDIAEADVYYYDEAIRKFIMINEAEAENILNNFDMNNTGCVNCYS